MDVRSIALTAGARTRITQPGRFFMLIATGEALTVRFERNRSEVGEIARDVEAGYQRFPGDWSDPDDGRFDSVVLESTNAQTITFGISTNAADYRRTVGVVDVNGPNAMTSTADVATIGNAANVSVIAANANRKKVHITALGTNTVNLRIGDTNITQTRGLQLAAGLTLTLETTAQVFARAEGAGTNQGVSILEETRT